MPPNPSHLEAVDPVLNGMARAAATTADQPGPPIVDKGKVLAILIHGDAAFPGQGVVAETLNLSRLDGYDVGGIIHIIANNQLGFTTDPEESFSTSYASGLARGFKIPITHVNADDPVACIEAARLAIAYRQRFKLDYLIDLVGYRRYGHNEGDEPAFTQPQIYQIVAAHPTVREQYAKSLVESGAVTQEQADALVQARMAELEQRLRRRSSPNRTTSRRFRKCRRAARRRRRAPRCRSTRCRRSTPTLMTVPEGFTVHRKLERGRERRKAMFASPTERTIDWAAAEELAMATILADGVPIRFTGEDVERGTFSHRHARATTTRSPAKSTCRCRRCRRRRRRSRFATARCPNTRASASSSATTCRSRRRLVLWEAQYGDFINGAQIILDEYLTSGRAKWGMAPSLVLLLPHGYEGQGPDHSSARLERFLQRRRRHQHAHRQLHDGGAVLPPAAAAGAAARRPIRCRSS